MKTANHKSKAQQNAEKNEGLARLRRENWFRHMEGTAMLRDYAALLTFEKSERELIPIIADWLDD